MARRRHRSPLTAVFAGEHWFDEAAGPIVRPYTVTGGRTRTAREGLKLITLVVAVGHGRELVAPSPGLGPEHRRILSLCQNPVSVAELAAGAELPVSVVKILLGDLLDRDLVMSRSAAAPDLELLQAVIDGIRRL